MDLTLICRRHQHATVRRGGHRFPAVAVCDLLPGFAVVGGDIDVANTIRRHQLAAVGRVSHCSPRSRCFARSV